MDLLEKSLKKAFINQLIEGSIYDPKLVINQPSKKEYVLDLLQEELDQCHEFFFSVAFITQDGLNGLKSHLADLESRGIKGRILTSTYLQFNQPFVFESLMNIPNIEVRISEKTGFHAKGYLFEQDDYQSFVIGSSNLTMSALKVNYEWNVRLTSYEQGALLNQVKATMQEEWEKASALTADWIVAYEKNYHPENSFAEMKAITDQETSLAEYIHPNKMQEKALEQINDLRVKGAKKALVISATGTGKTYLAAFDVAQYHPKKMLFIVHREQILKAAMASFKKVIHGEESDFGILSGNRKDIKAKYLFATIQTISKREYQEMFAQDAFDYMIIDEVHKAGAESYRKTIEYFSPDFLLGMTATPERTDDFNIFELFDYNIAYEIRLQEALAENLLCPFHYFGVTDYEKNGEVISETADLQYLVVDERIDYLLEKIDYYGSSKNKPRGLIFCSRKDEAKKLCESFNKRGRFSACLTGEDTIDKREREVERLENGEIQYIFTVDVFNEGIDIPMINQVIMLRNTQSSIIFIQQLGRGLRKDPSKDFVTVIDFIGNYKNNYMIPMALSGDISNNKNNLRRNTYETNYITGVSSVNFEKVAKERVFQSIDLAKLDSFIELRKSYKNLKIRLNRIPYLADFQENNVIDPQIFFSPKLHLISYYDFLLKMDAKEGEITESENKMLGFLSREIMPGMRKQELIIVAEMIRNPREISFNHLQKMYQHEDLLVDSATFDSVLATLTTNFYTGMDGKKYLGAAIIDVDEKKSIIFPSKAFLSATKNRYFVQLVEDIIRTALMKSNKYDLRKCLTRYQKYQRKEAIRLLNWKTQMVNQNIGGYVLDKENKKFVIFVTLEKGEDFQGALMAYEDALLDEKTMRWFSKAGRSLKSPEIKVLQAPDEWEIDVFAKKSDDEGTDFYYLGEVKPKQETIQEMMKTNQEGKKQRVVEMELQFLDPIDYKLFKYLARD